MLKKTEEKSTDSWETAVISHSPIDHAYFAQAHEIIKRIFRDCEISEAEIEEAAVYYLVDVLKNFNASAMDL